MIDESLIECTPKDFVKALAAEGIPAGHGYIGKPIYMSPILQEKRTYGNSQCPFSCSMYGKDITYREEDCPNAMEILRRLIVLPCNEFFSESDVNDISSAIEKVAAAYFGK